MLLINLEIVAFGRLKHCQLHFSPGLAILFGANEQGKSTILACIKALFYGFPNNPRNIRDNERRRYQPWDGSRMAANLVFEHQGVRYRLERTFAKTKSGDRSFLMDDVTGQVIMLASQKEVGESLLQITAEEFVNTVFIGQLASPIRDPDHSTLAKLANLTGSGDENLSYKRMDEQLREAQVRLKNEKGSGGLLNEWQRLLADWTEQRQEAVRLEQQQAERMRQLERLQEAVDQANRQLADAQLQISHRQVCKELEEWRVLQQQQQKLTATASELAKVAERLRPGELTADQAFVDACRQSVKAWQACRQELLEARRTVQREVANLAASEADGADLASLAAVDRNKLNQLLHDLDELHGLIIDHRETVRAEQAETLRQLEIRLADQKSATAEAVRQAMQEHERQTVLADSLTADQRRLKEQLADEDAALARFIDDATRQAELLTADLAASQAECNQRDTTVDRLQSELMGLDGTDPASRRPAALTGGADHPGGTDGRSSPVESGQSAGPGSARTDASDQASDQKAPTVRTGRGSTWLLVVGLISLAAGIGLGGFLHPAWAALAGAGLILVIAYFLVRSGRLSGRLPPAQAGSAEAAATATLERTARRQVLQARLEGARGLAEASRQALRNLEVRQQSAYAALKQEHSERLARVSSLNSAWSGLEQRLDRQQAVIRQAQAALLQAQTDLQTTLAAADKERLTQLPKTSDPRLDALVADYQERQRQLAELLAQTGSQDISDLQRRLGQQASQQEQLDRQHRHLALLDQDLAAKAQAEKAARTRLLDYFGLFAPESDPERIEERLDWLADQLHTARLLGERLHQQELGLAESLTGESWADYDRRMTELARSIGDESAESALAAAGQAPNGLARLDPAAAVEAARLLAEDLQAERNARQVELAGLASAIRHSRQAAYRVVDYDDMICDLQVRMRAGQQHYDGLTQARTLFQEAFAELQASFGPRLNEQAARILGELTGQRYTDVKVDRSFAIKVAAPEDQVFHEWDYLSGGTVDQVYLALRLAVAGIITQAGQRMPLLLDDIFVQYDDQRALAGLRWLQNLSVQEKWQALLFTSHQRLPEMAVQLDQIVPVIPLADQIISAD